MTGLLEGRTALVTGASGAIGGAIARRLAREGAAIVAVGRDRDSTEAICTELRAGGASAKALVADLASRSSVHRLIADVAGRVPGGVDILVSAAGGVESSPSLLARSEEAFGTDLELNLASHYLIAQSIARSMVQRRRAGRIVFVSSTGAEASHTSDAIYDAAKAGLESLTRSFATELGPHGILVNALQPGNVVNGRAVTDEATAPNRARWVTIPLGRPGRPEELAEVVVLMVSPANTYMTGAVLRVDGGRNARSPAPDDADLERIWAIEDR